jgi:hypothetical protein
MDHSCLASLQAKKKKIIKPTACTAIYVIIIIIRRTKEGTGAQTHRRTEVVDAAGPTFSATPLRRHPSRMHLSTRVIRSAVLLIISISSGSSTIQNLIFANPSIVRRLGEIPWSDWVPPALWRSPIAVILDERESTKPDSNTVTTRIIREAPVLEGAARHFSLPIYKIKIMSPLGTNDCLLSASASHQ